MGQSVCSPGVRRARSRQDRLGAPKRPASRHQRPIPGVAQPRVDIDFGWPRIYQQSTQCCAVRFCSHPSARPLPRYEHKHALPISIQRDVESALKLPLREARFLAVGEYSEATVFQIQVGDVSYILRVAGPLGLQENIPVLRATHGVGVAVPQVIAHDVTHDRWLVEDIVPGQGI